MELSIMKAHDGHLSPCSDIMTQIIKGKRTKRQRLPSPLRLGMAVTYSSTASSSAGRTVTDGYDSGVCDGATTNSSVATSEEVKRSKEEEEDMANCLMLLAQGQRSQYRSQKVSQTPIPADIRNQGVTQNVYQCKTCDKCFSSFQSLGGHRASHKRPKAMSTDQETKQLPTVKVVNDQKNDLHNESTSLQILSSININSNRQKVHECSLCGAVFSSGQALGGHMRRHRSVINHTAAKSHGLGTSSPERLEYSRKARSILRLDLNLPAPEDESKLTDQVLVFSATPLVDCYY